MAANTLGSFDEAIARQEDLEGAPAQYARQGMTIEWMMNLAHKRTQNGKSDSFRLYSSPATGARRDKLLSGANGEWPVGQNFGTQGCIVLQADHRIFRVSTPPMNLIAQEQSETDE